MSTVAKRRYTPAEYLALERTSEERHEFYRGEIFAMAGGTERHATICDNLLERVRSRLRGGQCRAYSSSLRVKIEATGLYTYPDLTIVCGERLFEDEREDTLLNPRVIIEVLSASTESYDRGKKFGHYQQVPSLAEYILVAQEEPRIDRFVRQEHGWLMVPVAGIEQELEITAAGIRVPLREIYENVTFGEDAKQQRGAGDGLTE